MKKNIYSCGIITPSDVIESSIISFVRPACFHGAYSTSSTKSTFFRRSVGRSFFTTSKLFFQLIFILLAFFGYGQTVQTVTLTNGTTWTVPCGVTTITVEAWGAGGGGGYRSLAGAEGGYGNAGGGGGAYEIKTFTASPGTNILYKIGKGGSGGPKVITSGINSKDGTDTTLTYGSTVVLTAKGGEGANDNAVKNDSVTYGFGGKSTSTGKSGGKGGNGGKSNNLDYGGGGGGAGYPGGVGNAGVIRYGGSSSQFNTYGGAGGDGGENSSSPAPKGTGKSGSGFGGGGGGALKFLDGSPLGGDGANGGIIISYTLPKIETTSSSTVYCESSAVNIEHTTVGVTTISAVGLPTGLTATYANNVIKISGTLAAGQKGSFPYAIVPNGCESFKFTGILTVNPTPTITGVSTSAVCAGSGATIKLTGLIPNSTSTVSYTISGRAQAPVTGVVADASGAASFLSAVLNISDDYKNLVITGITVTSATPNCGQVFNQSVQIRVSVPPVTPTANPGSGATCEQITTKWSTSANASGYYLDVSTVNSFASYVTGFSNLDVGNVTSKNIIGLSANTTYYYRVRAYNSCGTSASSVVTAYATSSVAIPSTANAYSPTCSGFTAQWGYASNSTTYFIDVATDSGFTNIVSAYNNFNVGNVTNYTLTGLNPATTYYYRVRASGCGTSANSQTMNYSTSSVTIPGTATANSPTCSGFTAQWGYASNATTYFIDVATDSGFTNIVSAYNNFNVGNVTNYTLTGLNPATTYYYRVRASGCGTSANSQTMNYSTSSVTIPGTATANSPTCSGFTAQWGYASNATTYFIDVATDSGFTNIVSAYNNFNVGNVTNYTLTGLNPATTYYYRVRASGCGTSANSQTMNYSTSLVPTVPPVAQAVSPNGDCSAIVVNWSTVANATGYYLDISTDSAFTSFVSGYNNYNIGYNGTNFYAGGLPAGILYYRLRAYNNCGVTGNSNIISFSTATPSIPLVNTNTQTDCANTGSVVLTGLPESGTIKQTGTVVADYPITGTKMTISGLAAGSYQFAVLSINGYCISGNTGNVIIHPAVTNTWNGSTWLKGTPDSTQALIFTGKYPPAVDPNVNIDGCSCTVQANVTIKSGTYLKIQNGLDVSSGTLTVESDANLIQVNPNAVNSGIITVKRDLKFSTGRQQYNYLISPVKNVSLKDIYKNDAGAPVTVPFVLYHNEADNKFYNSTGAYILGRALAVKEATAAAFPGGNGQVMSATFKGEPMNGNFSYTLANSKPTDNSRGYNLIGNPYPSNLDLVAFYNANSATKALSPTFNLWDSTANSQTTQMGDAYGGQAYAQFNAATPPGEGTGATAPAKGNSALTGRKIPTQFIKVGQGFMAKTAVDGLVVNFSNTMRSGAPAEAFFGRGTQESVSFDRYWLNLTSPAQITSQMAVVYFEGGNDAYTPEDSRSLLGSDAIYSIVDGEFLSINGKSAFAQTDVLSLGTNHFADGAYTISLSDEKDGIFADGQNIYLKDKLTGVIANLSQGSYTFQAGAGEVTGRFDIIYKPETVLITEGAAKEGLVVYRNGSDFVVKAPSKKVTAVDVVDLSGRLIMSLSPNSTTAVINAEMLTEGVYILKIKQGDTVTVRKVMK